MPRFFMNQIMPGDASAVLTGEQAAHARVLRLKPGEEIVLCDGQGTDYAARVQEITDGQILCSIQSSGPSASEPRVHCTVYMGFSKGDKLEHVIQKATELGADRIAAFPSSRCVAKYDRKSLEKKLPRWQKIAASAAEQSGRGRIPSVLTVNSYIEAVERAARSELPLFPYENERTVSLRAAIGRASLAEVACRRDQLDAELKEVLEAKLDGWGIDVIDVEVRDIVVPRELQPAMAAAAVAARERDARMTLAEAEADISDMLKDASASYAGDPEAMRLRTMHLAYESVKQSGGTLVIPSAFSEGFTDPDTAEALAKAAKQG